MALFFKHGLMSTWSNRAVIRSKTERQMCGTLGEKNKATNRDDYLVLAEREEVHLASKSAA